jgi:hypothetical protein
MNFSFDGFDTEPTSVDPLASKSEGKGLDNQRVKSLPLFSRRGLAIPK